MNNPAVRAKLSRVDAETSGLQDLIKKTPSPFQMEYSNHVKNRSPAIEEQQKMLSRLYTSSKRKATASDRNVSPTAAQLN